MKIKAMRDLWPSPPRKNRIATRYIAVHRSMWPRGHKGWERYGVKENDPRAMREFFRNPKRGTGTVYPYHLMLDLKGQVLQMLPKDSAGTHAYARNHDSIALAVIGDFTMEPPNLIQRACLPEILAFLLERYPNAQICGHTGLEKGTTDPSKVCPGPKLRLEERAKEARELVARRHDSAWRIARGELGHGNTPTIF